MRTAAILWHLDRVRLLARAQRLAHSHRPVANTAHHHSLEHRLATQWRVSPCGQLAVRQLAYSAFWGTRAGRGTQYLCCRGRLEVARLDPPTGTRSRGHRLTGGEPAPECRRSARCADVP